MKSSFRWVGPATIVLLCCTALDGWARGRGHDYFLLSAEGKLIRPLGSRYPNSLPQDWIDGLTETVYRWDGKELIATSFAGQKRWSYSPPKPLDFHTQFRSRIGVLAVTSRNHDLRIGLDPKTGTELYRIPLEAAMSTARNIEHPDDATRSPPGHYFLVPDRSPPALKKMDLRTGKIVWETQLPARTATLGELHHVSHGVVQFTDGSYCFDPVTGAELTAVPTDTKSTRQLIAYGEVVFHLSTGPSPVLSAFALVGGKRLWTMQQLEGVREIIGPYAHGRLLCRSENALFVIDGKEGRMVAKLTAPHASADGNRYRQTEKHVLILSPKSEKAETRLACFAVPSGKLLWSRTPSVESADDVALGGEVVLLPVADPRGKTVAGAKEPPPPPVVAWSLVTGEEVWRWQVPRLEKQFADSVDVRVETCGSGFLVTRTWIVLD